MGREHQNAGYNHSRDLQFPYERNSIENYYSNPVANATFNTDRWQLLFSNKCRIQRMMTYYWPAMSEEQALRCLQQGNFGMELASPQVTTIMKRLTLIILAITAILFGSVSCQQNGWIPVSMRDEWWTIYGPQVKRN